MKHKIVAFFSMAALGLSSCTTVDPYTGQQKTSNTIKGTAIGAASGAALGALIGNSRSGGKSRKYAVTGALLGALAGAGIGNYMDTQETLIRNELRGSGVSVSRIGNDIVLHMPSDITFATGKSTVKPNFARTLGSVALVMKKYARTHVTIVGHTDSDGGASYNQRLSVSRARAVAGVINRYGVASGRLHTFGKGESQPIASNNTRAGKAKNRRVEIRIVPQSNQF